MAQPTPDENKMGGEVTATEGLMREHGILPFGEDGFDDVVKQITAIGGVSGSLTSLSSLRRLPRKSWAD